MAVNNFAPAEYGGYVLGANSGGGSSPFEQMLGITGYAEVIVNFTLPEGEIPANGKVDVEMGILNSLDSASSNTDIRTYIATDTISVVIQVPLSSNHVTTLTIASVDNSQNMYIVDQYTSLSGDVEFHQDEVWPEGVIVVNGDGVVNATMNIA